VCFSGPAQAGTTIRGSRNGLPSSPRLRRTGKPELRTRKAGAGRAAAKAAKRTRDYERRGLWLSISRGYDWRRLSGLRKR